MKQLDVLEKEMQSFVAKIAVEEQYKHLDLSCKLYPNFNATKSVEVSSNASLSVNNSVKAVNVIMEEVRAQIKNLSITTPIAVNIHFTKKTQKKTENAKGSAGSNSSNTSGKVSFVCEKPKYKLKDVILPEETRIQVEETIALMSNFDKVYKEWNFYSKEPSAKTNICFYGLPGTGKTMCAHGMAQHLNMPILIASYADIQSEYVGVGPKNLRDVFKVAEENNALLFFDEADSFLRKRTSDTSSSAAMHYNSMTNEMMKHLEDFNGVVIFATNLTENTDEAFKTRLASSIEFKAPDEEVRAKIIKSQIPEEVPLLTPFTDEDFLAISKECEGFVGRDIRNAIKKILCVGASTGNYPFTVESFIDGFRSYAKNKSSFDDTIAGKDKGSDESPLDMYTANGAIMQLLVYAVWYDGKESEGETEILKKYSKILSRTKPVITKLTDLPDLEEICDELKTDKQKLRAMEYVIEVLSVSGDDDKNKNFILDVISKLHLNETYNETFKQYYMKHKDINQLKKVFND